MNRMTSVSTATDKFVKTEDAVTLWLASQPIWTHHACDGYDLIIRSGDQQAYIGRYEAASSIIDTVKTHIRLLAGVCGKGRVDQIEHGASVTYQSGTHVDFEVHLRECAGHLTEFGETKFQNSASEKGSTTVSMDRLIVLDHQRNIVETEWNVWVMADLEGLEAGVHPQDIPSVIEALKGLHARWLSVTSPAAA
ncbi:hypothetical protein P9209_22535 [Prescottella defluvii]|nr:hypothetical protein P9209_22535 [Prescottella defluvii]